MESLQGHKLIGHCRSVHTCTSRYSLSRIAEVPPEDISLLGHCDDGDELPPLRDGDIVHFVRPPDDTSRAAVRPAPWLLALAALRVPRASLWLALSWTIYAPGSVDMMRGYGFMPAQSEHPPTLSVSSGSMPPLHLALPTFPVTARDLPNASLLHLKPYLAARGAPPVWRTCAQGWELDMQPMLECQARLNSIWGFRAMQSHLPHYFPAAYHAAWCQHSPWSGGVPDSLLIATDGSGASGGTWAFLAWCCFKGRWHRIGWDAGSLSAVPWGLPHLAGGPTQHSYAGELVALQAAAIWCTSALDFWRTYTGAAPRHVTIAVDNAAALQVAAGHANTTAQPARVARVLWQTVQARTNTEFRHIHSHVGVMVNTLDDALAAHAQIRPTGPPYCQYSAQALGSMLADVGEHLWLVPRASMTGAGPVYRVLRADDTDRHETTAIFAADTTFATSQLRTAAGSGPPTSIPVVVLTANVQSMKDAASSIFNPSGHAARRQYLLKQVQQIPCDILCIQEARSKAGRWNTGGWLSWRSGHLQGQYGCEVWIRPEVVSPPLSLSSWRIVESNPRMMLVTCVDPRFPVSVCSAHAPHAERPDKEACSFCEGLHHALLKAPSGRGLILGIDANADFHSSDPEEVLLGAILASGEPARNDLSLFELSLRHSLFAPATHEPLQRGPGWSWEHTSGRRRRLDHVLLQTGPWEAHSASQALDFDIVNCQRDHVPLRVYTTLYRPSTPSRSPPQPRKHPSSVLLHGRALWQHARANLAAQHSAADRVADFVDLHAAWQRQLPSPARAPIRQPYLCATTVAALEHLRDWRTQVRLTARVCRAWSLWRAFVAWAGRSPLPHHKAACRDAARLHALMSRQEMLLGRRVHNLAHRDKRSHFIALTRAAVDQWHHKGCASEAIVQLRWASRKAAERRAAHAAGGYDIDAQLEEQFRAQEDGRHASPAQVSQAIRRWASTPAPMCVGAIPSRLDMEHACRKQQAGKAPGPDHILNEVWRHFPVAAGEWLWDVCTRIALAGHEPAHFKAALVCALYKKGPAALPQNYRSIALLNGVAKLWHGHLRRTIGGRVLQGYDSLQLGGRKGVPVGFAVAVYRAAVDLSIQLGRSVAILFIDIQAAYYEASRSLVFSGDSLDSPAEGLSPLHLQALASQLLHTGALELLGVPADERALLHDCVACSYWRLVSSDRYYLASRGSRPGDGLADVIFGALFSIALRHIRAVCRAEGIGHWATGQCVGGCDDVLPLGWADDLAIISDYDSPLELQRQFPRLAEVAVSALQALKFRVNLGAGKTEALLDIRGPKAKEVRRELLTGSSSLHLAPAVSLRVAAEYRYLGVVQTTKDTGRRDNELSAQRAYAAWAHGRRLISSGSLPWELKFAWISGRVLPAAYATLATSPAVSARAWSPLHGFFERASRALAGSWRFGHFLPGQFSPFSLA